MNATHSNAAGISTTYRGAPCVIRGNYKISTDKRGRMIAHRWWKGTDRWVRCDLAAALSNAPEAQG